MSAFTTFVKEYQVSSSDVGSSEDMAAAEAASAAMDNPQITNTVAFESSTRTYLFVHMCCMFYFSVSHTHSALVAIIKTSAGKTYSVLADPFMSSSQLKQLIVEKVRYGVMIVMPCLVIIYILKDNHSVIIANHLAVTCATLPFRFRVQVLRKR